MGFNMHGHFISLFIYFGLRRVGFPPRFPLSRRSREEFAISKAILLLRISRGVSVAVADCGALECWGKSFAAHSSQANSGYQPGLINSTKPLERLFIRASQTITEVNPL